MPLTIRALVTPSILAWARSQLGMTLVAAARKVGVLEERVAAWESGASQPTLRQARLLAAVYRQPLAAFFLDQVPKSSVHVPRDYRRFAGSLMGEVPSELHRDVADSWDRRSIALELLQAEGREPPRFRLTARLGDDPETTGAAIRKRLNVTTADQSSWRDARRGFNSWREHVEAAGVLVLQTSAIPIGELRAYSLTATPLPIITLNRKDAPAGRIFSLLHEVTHLALHSEGICDLQTDVEREPEAQRLEVFCNAVAAACLMPRTTLLSHPVLTSHEPDPTWHDREIETLSRFFSCSREAVLRRLLTLKKTTDEFYRMKRREYQQEYDARPPTKGFLSPPADRLSLYGRPFVRLVLEGLERGSVTTSDASDYLGLRVKHFPALEAAVGGE